MDRLNQELDEAVMDMVGANDGATHSSDDEELPTTTAAAAQAKKDADKSQPILTPAQKRMIENLNSIPHLKKNLLFFDQIANSHGTIVCRDLKKFEFHKRGLGGLQHWADHFEL